MLNLNDLNYVSARGIDVKNIEKQFSCFKNGFPFINLIRPASTGDGILAFTGEERNFYITWFDQHFRQLKVLKFVPASGAASRMFKKLFEFLDEGLKDEIPFNEIEKKQGDDSIYHFLTNIKKFAFYDDLKNSLQNKGLVIDDLLKEGKYKVIIRELLDVRGMDYANLPKALIKFHSYPEGSRVALEEHLVEAGHYSVDFCSVARIHFTVSPEHIAKFDKKLEEVTAHLEKSSGVHYRISHSIQEPSTDTIAVDLNNEPVRNADGSLLFRPAGHGALLQNLLIPDADIIFIKNIDNVVPDRLKQETYLYKRIIGGYLLFIRDFIFNYLNKAVSGSVTDQENFEAIKFAQKFLSIDLSPDLEKQSSEIISKELITQFNRPVRVCGMVKNEGEPGGGPFWVNEASGRISLQIVESAQIDMKNVNQKKISDSATHFNPVDIVCCLKDFNGNKFELNKFVDESSGLISIKSAGGREIKAMELPGLWNGSMSGWITIFVEVPVVTFNPVKTVNDLLRDEHQS